MGEESLEGWVRGEIERRLGYADHMDAGLLQSSALEVERTGAAAWSGLIIRSSREESLRELHVFPHGGDLLPEFLVAPLLVCDRSMLASAAWAEGDVGSLALASRLVGRLATGELNDIAVAVFPLSRLLVDANRVQDRHRVRAVRLGIGDETIQVMREPSDDEVRQLLVASEVELWTARVNAVIRESRPPLVVHHHTCNERGQLGGDPEATFEHEPGRLREAGQIFAAPNPAEQERRTPMLDEQLQEPVRKAYEQVLRNRLSQAHARLEVGIDSPFFLPRLPFHRASLADGSLTRFLIFETRKDLLTGAERGLAMREEALACMSAVIWDALKS